MVKSPKAQGEEVLGERASSLSQEPLFSLKSEAPNKSRGPLKPTSQTNAGSVGEVGHLKMDCPTLKEQRAVSRGECLNSPKGLRRHSTNELPKAKANASIGTKSATGGDGAEDLVTKKEQGHEDVCTKSVGRANKDKIFINGQPVTALLDTGSQVTHVSQDFCLANGIKIHPINQLVNIEGQGDTIEYVGYIEAKLSLPIGTHTFEIEALLLVLPTTEYKKRVPVAIGTTITDMAVDFMNENHPENMSKSWKAVCCATQSRRLIQAQPSKKGFIKTTKPVTLPPFSTTIIKDSAKLRSHGMRLNLIAEPSKSTDLPPSVQCAPTYCTLEPGSNRLAVVLEIFLPNLLQYHQGLLWVIYNRQRWYLKFRRPLLKKTKTRVPVGGRRGPWFGPVKFRGFKCLDSRPAAGSQRSFD